MKELDLSLIASKLRKLKNDSEDKDGLSKKLLVSMNDVVLLNFLSGYMDEVEGNSGASSIRKDLLSVRLVNEFLNVAKKKLIMSEYRMKREDPRFLMGELRLEIEKCLIITSNFVFRVSGRDYYRGLLSREFPSILGVLLTIAGSSLLGIQLRCQILQASLELMKNQSDDRILQSIHLRKCLSEEGEEGKALSRLWRSLCQHKEMHLSSLFDSSKEFVIPSSFKKNVCSESPSILFATLVLEVYSNLLHFQRYLTNKMLKKISVGILCGKYVDVIFELSISPYPKICFLSGIILRSLLLDSDERQYKLINEKVKNNRVLLIYLARIIYEGFTQNVDHTNIDNSILYAQIVSILSQYDSEIYDLITRIFPRKFFRIFENRWFKRNFLVKDSSQESQGQLNMLPWFPTSCSWYDMRTNVLANDSPTTNTVSCHFNHLETFKSKIMHYYDFSGLESILSQNKSMLVNVFQESDASLIVQELVERYYSLYSDAKELAICCYNSLFKDQSTSLDGFEFTIRRHPDFTWYIFWDLCRDDYQDQLDLIWDQTVKNEAVSVLINEYNQSVLAGRLSRSNRWTISSFFPEIPKISREIQISDSVYFRLLIPTLIKMRRVSGLFHLEVDECGEAASHPGVHLHLQSPNLVNVGYLFGYCFRPVLVKEARCRNLTYHRVKQESIQEPANYVGKIGRCVEFIKNRAVNILGYNQDAVQDEQIRGVSLQSGKKLEDITIRDLVINNHCLNEWEVLDCKFGTSFEKSSNYLDERFFKKITYAQVPYLECIESVDKVRVLMERLFQKIVSETTSVLKSYMLYGYTYYIIVFNEYLSGRQIMGHLQYLITLLISASQSDPFYKGLLIYILHIILSIYEDARGEFLKMGGLLLVNEFLMRYQKGWSASKQLGIYNDENILREIKKGLRSRKGIDWRSYVELFVGREGHMGNYKLFDGEIQQTILKDEYQHYGGGEGKSENLECREPQVFIIDVPEMNSLIREGMLLRINQKLMLGKMSLEELRGLDHQQYMNIWTTIISEDQLRLSIKDYLNLSDQIESMISDIPSEIDTNECFNSSINCATPNDQEVGVGLENGVVRESAAGKGRIGMGGEKEGLLNRMYDYDLLSYRELLTWLITMNNCILQSKIWLSRLIKSDEFEGTIKMMIRLLLSKNKIKGWNICRFGLKENYHIFWICRILINVLREEPGLIVKWMDYRIVEILIMQFMRFDSGCGGEGEEDFEYVRDEVIRLFRLCLMVLNKFSKDEIFKDEKTAFGDKRVSSFKRRESKFRCSPSCNVMDGCIYGDIICLIFHMIDDFGVENNIEIEELRMVEVFGNGVFYASRYIPVSILQILGIHEDGTDQVEYKKILEFKNSLGLCNNHDQVRGIRMRWDSSKRIRLLIKLSRILHYQALEIDYNNDSSVVNEELVPMVVDWVDYQCGEDLSSAGNLLNGIGECGDRLVACRDLNIFGYYLDSLSEKLREEKRRTFDEMLGISSDEMMVERWVGVSREHCSCRLIKVMELDEERMTLIFQNHVYKILNHDHKSKHDACIYKNMWNILQYHLYLYFRYYIQLEKGVCSHRDYILRIIVKLLELQRDLFVMGVSYVEDGQMKVLHYEFRMEGDKIFNQLIDTYYHQVVGNSSIKESVVIIYYLDLCKIIGERYMIVDGKMAGRHDSEYEQLKRIYSLSLSMVNLVREYCEYNRLVFSDDLELWFGDLGVERLILFNWLSGDEIVHGLDMLGVMDEDGIVEEILFKYDQRSDLLDHNQVMLSLVLYRVYQRVRCGVGVEDSAIHLEIFDLLVKYLIKMGINFEGGGMIMKIIKEYVKNCLRYVLRGMKMGLFSNLLNVLIRKDFSVGRVSIRRKREMYEILLLMYAGRHCYVDDSRGNIIKEMFESLLTPAICRIMEKRGVDNYEMFVGIMTGQVITSGLIWTKGMYNQLLEWTSSDLVLETEREEVRLVDYRERYYRVVNEELGDARYNFLNEDYIMGLYKLLYILDYESGFLVSRNYNYYCIEVDFGEIMDQVFERLARGVDNGFKGVYSRSSDQTDEYLSFVYKLMRNHGFERCFCVGGNGCRIVEYIRIMDGLIENREEVGMYLVKESGGVGCEIKDMRQSSRMVYIMGIIGEIKAYMERGGMMLVIQGNRVVENGIRVEMNKFVLRLIIYIQDEYILKMNEDDGNMCLEGMTRVLNKLMGLYVGCRGVEGEGGSCMVDSECEDMMILLAVNTMLIMFKYESLLVLGSGWKYELIRELIGGCIGIIRERIVNIGYVSGSRLDGEKFRLVYVLEMIIYPLSNQIGRRLRKLLSLDVGDFFSHHQGGLIINAQNAILMKMIKKLVDKERSIVDIILMFSGDGATMFGEKEGGGFIEWFVGDHEEVMLEWTQRVRLGIYRNLRNIKRKMIKYFKVCTKFGRNRRVLKLDYELLERIIKYENYVGMMKDYKEESLGFVVGKEKVTTAGSCFDRFQRSGSCHEYYCKNYILKLILIREVNDLTSLLLREEYRMRIELVLIKKFRDFEKLLWVGGGSRDDDVFVNNGRQIMIMVEEDENHSKLNEEMRTSRFRQNERMYRVGNVHPSLRRFSSVYGKGVYHVSEENLHQEDDLVRRSEAKSWGIGDYLYNKKQALIIIKDMIQILLIFTTRTQARNAGKVLVGGTGKILVKLVDEILTRMIIYALDRVEDFRYCVDHVLCDGMDLLELDLMGEIIIGLFQCEHFVGMMDFRFVDGEREIFEGMREIVGQIRDLDKLVADEDDFSFTSLYILRMSIRYSGRIFSRSEKIIQYNKDEMLMFKNELNQVLERRVDEEDKDEENENGDKKDEMKDFDPISNAMMMWGY